MDSQELVWFLIALITVSVGGAMGWRRGRTGDGIMLSLLFDVLGWYLVSTGPDLRCPECRKVTGEGAWRCPHCTCRLEGVREG